MRCGGDISDGLLIELERITDMSGCSAEIWLDSLPVEPALVSDFGAAWPDLAVGGGEDFELVAALPEAAAGALLKSWPDDPGAAHRGRVASAWGLASRSSTGKEAPRCRCREPARGTSRERRRRGRAVRDRG